MWLVICDRPDRDTLMQYHMLFYFMYNAKCYKPKSKETGTEVKHILMENCVVNSTIELIQELLIKISHQKTRGCFDFNHFNTFLLLLYYYCARFVYTWLFVWNNGWCTYQTHNLCLLFMSYDGMKEYKFLDRYLLVIWFPNY